MAKADAEELREAALSMEWLQSGSELDFVSWLEEIQYESRKEQAQDE